jgi:glycosyltransferase involved in cell wall biosynthesis
MGVMGSNSLTQPRRKRSASHALSVLPMIRRILRPVFQRIGLGRRSRKQRLERRPPILPIRLEEGLCITGYFMSEIGLGQAARNLAHACETQRLPVSFYNVPLPGRDNEYEFATKCNTFNDRELQLLVMGLPTLRELKDEPDDRAVKILYPYWELSRVPAELLTFLGRFDEVWAPSTFVAAAFADTVRRPVRLVRQPVHLPAVAPPPRSRRDTLRLLTYFDYDSRATRKNPIATVNAFRAAFPPERRDVELVVKSRGSPYHDDNIRRLLRRLAAADPRIRLIDRTVDRAVMNELMASCDVFVSLHRSEGFGFGPAEALAAGKAVVATDYGGTTDFITQATAFPIEYTLEPVQPGEYVHSGGQVWATARQESAVAALRAIYDDPGEADTRARRGFAFLQQHHALSFAGAEIARLLRDISMV